MAAVLVDAERDHGGQLLADLVGIARTNMGSISWRTAGAPEVHASVADVRHGRRT